MLEVVLICIVVINSLIQYFVVGCLFSADKSKDITKLSTDSKSIQKSIESNSKKIENITKEVKDFCTFIGDNTKVSNTNTNIFSERLDIQKLHIAKLTEDFRNLRSKFEDSLDLKSESLICKKSESIVSLAKIPK